jgi:3-oxoadipate enol-lactonase
MARMFPTEFVAANPAIIADRKAVFCHIDPAVFASAARALATLDLGPDLHRIRNPVQIVVGEKDGATTPALGRELAARLPDARIVELPGIGHAPHVQAPGELLKVISPFLELG